MNEAGIPWAALLEGARVAGDTLGRLADTEVRLFHDHVHGALVRAGLDEADVAARIRATGEAAVPLAETLVVYVHRQHLARAVAEDAFLHLEASTPQTTAGQVEVVVLFVDLALFTALADVHGDETAAAVLDRFDHLVRNLGARWRGHLVKQIGDEFMLTFVNSVDAVAFARSLSDAAALEEEFPALRVGMNAGPAMYRLGDYVGTTINIAARVTSIASPGEILMTQSVASAVGLEDMGIEPLGVRTLRGVSEPVSLYRIRGGAPVQGRDPVCGMTVGRPAARLRHEGQEVMFCSEDCLRRFLADPSPYMPVTP